MQKHTPLNAARSTGSHALIDIGVSQASFSTTMNWLAAVRLISVTNKFQANASPKPSGFVVLPFGDFPFHLSVWGLNCFIH